MGCATGNHTFYRGLIVNTPSPDEQAESERHRNGQLWIVHREYEIVSGEVRPVDWDDEVRVYYPMAALSIIRDIQGLVPGDRRGLLAFARRWGRLGYPELVEGIRSPAGTRYIPRFRGDPVVWVWAHAAGVRTVLTLAQALRRRDANSIRAYIESIQEPDRATRLIMRVNKLLASGTPEHLAEAESMADELLLGHPRKATRHASLVFGLQHRVVDHLWAKRRGWVAVAEQIVETILNRHLAGVQISLQYVEGEVQVRTHFDALLGVVYRHLADVVAAGQLRECDYCATPFVQRHGHQRFCPPEPWVAERGGESACALRYRSEKRRKGGSP